MKPKRYSGGFSQKIADEICARMREGESLRTICKTPGYPKPSTVCLWADSHPEFAEQYGRAREALVDVYAQEVIDIADEPPEVIFSEMKGGYIVDMTAIAYQRHRTDSRKWYAGKVAPKKYGERLVHQGDPENPMLMGVLHIAADKVLEDRLKALDHFKSDE